GRAIEVAQGQGWAHLVVATWFTLASGQLGRQQHPEAMEGYRRAEAVARREHEAGQPWALQLVLHALLGQGSVCVAAGSWRLGTEVYAEGALPVAEAMADRRMQLECLRMAAYCDEQRGEPIAAWDRSAAALVVGDAIAPADRPTTTLAFVGEAMLRLAEHRSLQGRAPLVEREMTRLMGPSWRQYAQAGEPPADIDPRQPSPVESSPPPVQTVPASLSQARPSPAAEADPAGGASA
ncbi:MAG: hypothetical protein KDK70_34535, partial [Myxococcales bacterium]|nr:hypothetical protein [Myxococcales bacterium]